MNGQKRALVLAPHQDDELNIAGQVLPTLIELGYQCTICFSTDGNANGLGAIRAQEAMEAASLFGLDFNDVVFLNHLEVSQALPDHLETPHVYQDQYSKLLRDLIDLLERLTPDLVICVDFDWHPDHRMLSLAGEDALGDAMRRNSGYRPVFLKKFAYAASWDGPADYYSFAPCRLIEGDAAALDNPTLFWDERISLLPHPSSLTARLIDNIVYRAFGLYESQHAWPKARSVCSADVAYWSRRIDDLCLNAELAVSSGDVHDLLEFKRFDVRDVFERNPIKAISQEYGWRPVQGDECPLLLVKLEEPVEVASVECYWTPGLLISGDCVRVLADGEPVGFKWHARGCRMRLMLDEPVSCSELMLVVTEWPSSDARLTSIEVYPAASESLSALNDLVEGVNNRGLARHLSQWGKLMDLMLKLRVFFYYRLDI